MTHRKGTQASGRSSILVTAYAEKHAPSIGQDLFKGLSPEVVSEGRKSLLAPGPDEVYSVCAVHGDRVVGVCTGVRKTWIGERHRIEMVQVVVDEDFQKHGIARDMMRKIASHFSTKGVDIVQISAEHANDQAIKAYERIGFSRYGLLKDGLKYDGRYSDEIMLSIPLKELLD